MTPFVIIPILMFAVAIYVTRWVWKRSRDGFDLIIYVIVAVFSGLGTLTLLSPLWAMVLVMM
jgi:hypothetical protein